MYIKLLSCNINEKNETLSKRLNCSSRDTNEFFRYTHTSPTNSDYEPITEDLPIYKNPSHSKVGGTLARVESADFLELSVKCFVRKFISLINILSDCGVCVIMAEQVKVGLRGQVVIPKKLRKKLNIENGIILEIEETAEGLLLKPSNPVAELKGIGKNVFGGPLLYQRKL